MSHGQTAKFLACRGGNAAVEFAMLLPALAGARQVAAAEQPVVQPVAPPPQETPTTIPDPVPTPTEEVAVAPAAAAASDGPGGSMRPAALKSSGVPLAIPRPQRTKPTTAGPV